MIIPRPELITANCSYFQIWKRNLSMGQLNLLAEKVNHHSNFFFVAVDSFLFQYFRMVTLPNVGHDRYKLPHVRLTDVMTAKC